ncbi:MAG: hypothetical protein COB85_09435 [Bacteroidetes bacterium]|nr:MAG: hypothetical protein COB85_09435 [Bacteroidota bacterium]
MSFLNFIIRAQIAFQRSCHLKITAKLTVFLKSAKIVDYLFIIRSLLKAEVLAKVFLLASFIGAII